MPDSKVRMVLNSVVMFLLLYTASFVPYQTAFIDEDTATMAKLDIFFDVMFVCDFILNFLMAYEDKDKKIESRLKLIALNYLYSWALIDGLSCFPFQYLSPEGDMNTNAVDF